MPVGDAATYPLPGSSGNVSGLTGLNPITVMGYTVRETAGAAAVCRLRDGGATGNMIATVSLSANQSTSDWWGPAGIGTRTGTLYFQVVSGTIEGSVFIG